MVSVTSYEIINFLIVVLLVVLAFANVVVAIRQIQYSREKMEPVVNLEDYD